MCGIAGFVDKKGQLPVERRREVLDGMLDAIAHRGPDGLHAAVVGNVGVAHARLAVLDLSEAADQPMWNETHTKVLSFNGELYNHLDVRADLPETTYASHGDTATLLHAYEALGEACVPAFKGMFAFSLLDTEQEQLFFAVDRFGIKPLYYLDTEDWFAWSSEPKTFRHLPGFTLALNDTALREHLQFRSIAGDTTLFKDVRKLLPGMQMVYSLATNTHESKRYWGATDALAVAVVPTEGDIRNLLSTSVREHLLSDVPVGIQLSGGVDSSVVAALVREALPLPHVLHSYSIGLAEDGWNEFAHARAVAEQLGTVHHELVFTEREFCKRLPQATLHYDEPINHSHSVPMFLLAREAKKEVKVLMSGEGADEIFGGYRRYATLLAEAPSDMNILHSNQFVNAEQLARVIQHLPPADLHARSQILAEAKEASSFARTGWYDLRTYLPPLLLRQDKMGMASGLENRVPFLDHEVVRAGLALPDIDKLARGEGKPLLKRIAASYVPSEVVYRPKVGFGQPIAAWLRHADGLGAYLRFFTEPTTVRSYLDYDGIATLIEEHHAGADHPAVLWTLITLEVWMQVFVDGRTPEQVWNAIS